VRSCNRDGYNSNPSIVLGAIVCVLLYAMFASQIVHVYVLFFVSTTSFLIHDLLVNMTGFVT